MLTPALSNTLRSASQYFIEVALVAEVDDSVNPVTITFPNKLSTDISGLVRETSYGSRGGSKLYTFSVSDYFIKRAGDFDEASREPLVLRCSELTGGRTRYLSVFTTDTATGLSGANSAVVQTLPDNLTFEFGKINFRNPADMRIYHPNDSTEVGGEPSEDQRIVSVLIRFALNVSFLTE